MGKWVYTLKSGKGLRQAINNDDQLAVLTSILSCIDEIRAFSRYNIIYIKHEDVLDMLEIEAQDLIHEADLTSIDEDEINYLLDDFYDFCDDNYIWVDI